MDYENSQFFLQYMDHIHIEFYDFFRLFHNLS